MAGESKHVCIMAGGGKRMMKSCASVSIHSGDEIVVCATASGENTERREREREFSVQSDTKVIVLSGRTERHITDSGTDKENNT